MFDSFVTNLKRNLIIILVGLMVVSACSWLVSWQSTQTAQAANGGLTIFFKNTENWQNVYIYHNQNGQTWNGAPIMTKLSADNDGWWVYTIPNASQASFVFKAWYDDPGDNRAPANGTTDHYTNTDSSWFTFNRSAGGGRVNWSANPDTTDTTAPPAPTSLAVSNLTTSSFTLTWNKSTDAGKGTGVKYYEVFRDGTSVGTVNTFSASNLNSINNTYSMNVSGLTEKTTYSITVKAVDYKGNVSDASTATSVYTPAITVDGTNDFLSDSSVSGNETFATSTGSYFQYLTWDANNIYVGTNGGDLDTSNASKWYLAWVGGSGGSNSTLAYGGNTARTIPFGAKYHLRWKFDGTYFNGKTYTGGNWNTDITVGTSSRNTTNKMLEFSVPRSSLGSPNTLPYVGYWINETSGSEWQWASMPNDLFTDGKNTAWSSKFYEFDLTSSTGAASQWYNYQFRKNQTYAKSVTFTMVPKASGSWTGATGVKIQQSTDSGATWTDSTHAALTLTSTTATVTGLSAGTSYKFRLVVTGGTYAGSSTIENATTGTAYTLTYNGNGNTGGTAPSSQNNDTSTTATVSGEGTLTKTGYTFSGWNTVAGGGGTAYATSATYTFSASETLYAQWTANSYTVTFDGNGGDTPSPTSKSVTYASTYGALATVTRTGYTFDSWNTAANGSGTTITAATTVSITAAQTLYAKWTANTYTVTFDGNGGTPSTASTTVTYAATYGTLATGTRTGYSLSGWNTAANGSGTTITAASTVSITAAQTLYAQWTANTYTVTFNGNGGTSVAPSATVTYASTYGVLPTGNRTGYTFASWNTAANGSGSTITAATTVSITAAQTLYAQWTANTYTVTFDGNNGTPSTASTTVTYASTYGTLATGTRTGYTFASWNTAANGSGTTITAASTVSITAAQTLYAQWTINNYTVTYDGNTNTGGTVPSSQSGNYNTSITVAANSGSLVKTGYTFGGWNTAADGNGTNYTAGSGSYTIGAGNATLYAKWTINSYTITYSGNGSTGGTAPSSQSVTYNTSATLASNTGTLAKTGFSFAGWNTAADGSGTNYATGASYTIGAANVTLFAKWTVNSYTVSFDANGATSGSAPTQQSGNYNSSITLASNTGTLAKIGYTFGGWNTSAAGSGTNYAAGASYTVGASNVTLYAKWNINSYTITYDGNGNTSGSVPTAQITAYNAAVTVSDNTGSLAKTGYSFVIWNTQSDQSGFDLDVGTELNMPANDFTLYAIWAANNYTVSFDAQSGSAASSISVTYDSTYGTLPTTTRSGYTFGGWYTAAAGAGSLIQSSTTVSTASNHTLYAKWTANTYTVTFNANYVGGTVDPATQTKRFASTYGKGSDGSTNEAMPTPTRTGYTFASWNASQDGQGTVISGSTTVTTASNHTIYAQWTINQYTVTFNSNGGSAVSALSSNYNTTISQPSSPTKAGHTFAGWYTDTGLTTEYNFNTQLTSSFTLYAKWDINGYTVTFESNGGSAVSQQFVEFNQQATEPTAPTKTGYTFAGWFSNESLTTSFVFASTNITQNRTIYAKWSINSYSVTYDGNGKTAGSVPAAPTNYQYDSAVTILGNANTLVRTGYTWAGWNSAANGSGDDYGAGQSISMPASNLTLYAKWSNAAPTVISLSTQSINENNAEGATIGTLSATDADAGATFSYTLVSGAGSTDNATFEIDGSTLKTTVAFDRETKSSYSIRVRVTDNGGLIFDEQFTITVNNVNEKPTLSTISTLTGASEDTDYTITYEDLKNASNAIDVDAGTTIQFTVVAVSSGTLKKGSNAVTPGTTTIGPGESLTWKGATNANGTLNAFTVKAFDGALASDTAIQVAVTATAVNDTPTLSTITGFSVNEDEGLNITYSQLMSASNAADIDGDSLTFRIALVSSGTLTKNGVAVVPGTTTIASGDSVVWTPAANVNGSNLNAFTVVVTDGSESSTPAAQVKATVSAVPDAPTISSISDQQLTQNSSVTNANAIQFTIGDPDAADQSSLQLSFTSSNENLIASGDLTFGGSYPNRTLMFTPKSNRTGKTTITVKVMDGNGLFATETFDITVSPAAATSLDDSGKALGQISQFTVSWNSTTLDIDYYEVYLDGKLVQTASPVTAKTYTFSGTVTLADTTTITIQEREQPFVVGIVVVDFYGVKSTVATKNVDMSDTKKPVWAVPFGEEFSSITTAPVLIERTFKSVKIKWPQAYDLSQIKAYKLVITENGNSVEITKTLTVQEAAYEPGEWIEYDTATHQSGTFKLKPDTMYSFTIYAIDNKDNISSPQTDQVDGFRSIDVKTARDVVRPDQVIGLEQTAKSATTVTLEWDASDDNDEVVGYNVYAELLIADGVYRSAVVLGQNVSGTSTVISGLQPNRTYRFFVRAIDRQGNLSVDSEKVSVTTDEDTVGPGVNSGFDLTVTSITETEATLSWAGVFTDIIDQSNLTYEIKVNGVAIILNTSPLTATQYVVKGLVQGTEYTFSVLARDRSGNASSEVDVTEETTTDATNPTAPVVTKGTEGNVNNKITWTASVDANLTKYQIYLALPDGEYPADNSPTGEVLASAAREFTFTGLTPSTQGYKVKVCAVDAAGNRGCSVEITFNTTADTTKPTAPNVATGYTVTDRITDGYTLNWVAATDNDQVKEYEVYYLPAGSTGSWIKISGETRIPAATRTLVITSTLVPEINSSGGVHYKVVSYDRAGNASTNNVETPKTGFLVKYLDITKPNQPTDLAAPSLTIRDNQVTITWKPATDVTKDGNNATIPSSKIVRYNVYRDDVFVESVAAGTAKTFSLVVKDLQVATAYKLTVTAVDEGNNESDPAELNTLEEDPKTVKTTADTTLPTKPVATVVAEFNKLTFNFSSSDNVGVATYEYRIGTSGEFVTTPATLIISDLAPNTKRDIQVRAKDAAGNISAVTLISGTTSPDTTKPTNPTLTVLRYQTSIGLSWTASTDNLQLAGYKVFRVNGSTPVELATLGANVTRYEVSGLTPGTGYTFVIRAVDTAGNMSDLTGPGRLTTSTLPPTEYAPPTISIKTAVNTSEGSDGSEVEIQWVKPAIVSIMSYELFINGIKASTDIVATAETHKISKLEPSKKFFIAIRYKVTSTETVYSPFSNTLEVDTAADTMRPTKPTAIGTGFENLTSSSVKLKWAASTDNVAVDFYEIYKDTWNGTGYDAAETSFTMTSATTIDVTYLDTPMTKNTKYKFRVIAVDTAGNKSLESLDVEVTTIADTTPPSTPTAEEITVVEDLESHGVVAPFTISWPISTDNTVEEEEQMKYHVFINGVRRTPLEGITITEFTFEGVYKTKYKIQIAATDNDNNTSPLSAIKNFETAGDTKAPNAPSNVTANNVTSVSAEIGWNAWVVDVDDDIAVTQYKIYIGNTLLATVPASRTSANVKFPAVDDEENITVTVRAYDEAGNESADGNVTFPAVKDNQSPEAPLGLTIEYQASGTIKISWLPSYDNDSVVKYEILKNSGNFGEVTPNEETGKLDNFYLTTAGVNGIAPGDVISVRAHDHSENVSEESAKISVIAPAQTIDVTGITSVTFNGLFTRTKTSILYRTTVDTKMTVKVFRDANKNGIIDGGFTPATDDDANAVVSEGLEATPISTIMNNVLVTKGTKSINIPSYTNGHYIIQYIITNVQSEGVAEGEHARVYYASYIVDKAPPLIQFNKDNQNNKTTISALPDAESGDKNAVIHYNVSKNALVTISIANNKKQTVKSILTNYRSLKGDATFQWNGRDNKGNLLNDGVYTISFGGVDTIGNKGAIRTTNVTIERSNPKILSYTQYVTLKNSYVFTYNLSEIATVSGVQICSTQPTLVANEGATAYSVQEGTCTPLTNTPTISGATGLKQPGPNKFTISATSPFTPGTYYIVIVLKDVVNKFNVGEMVLPFTIDNVKPTISSFTATNMVGTTPSLTKFHLSENARVSVVVKRGTFQKSTVVKSLFNGITTSTMNEEGGYDEESIYSFSWDGKDAKGVSTPKANNYFVEVRVTDLAGNTLEITTDENGVPSNVKTISKS